MAFLTISFFTLPLNWNQIEKIVMKKFSFLITAAMSISMMAFSQTTRDNIEKLSKDPKTAENAAKADVYIVKSKKIISDTTSKEASNPPSASKNTRKKKKRNN